MQVIDPQLDALCHALVKKMRQLDGVERAVSSLGAAGSRSREGSPGPIAVRRIVGGLREVGGEPQAGWVGWAARRAVGLVPCDALSLLPSPAATLLCMLSSGAYAATWPAAPCRLAGGQAGRRAAAAQGQQPPDHCSHARCRGVVQVRKAVRNGTAAAIISAVDIQANRPSDAQDPSTSPVSRQRRGGQQQRLPSARATHATHAATMGR